ncbi:MAG: FecR family protein [Acidobacteriia bacterium]|nr:FecR family protein [Terriglobia bacterium]
MKAILPLHACDTSVKNGRAGSPRRRPIFSFSLLLAGIFAAGIVPTPIVFGATPADAPRATAAAVSGANVELNGAPIATGAALFPGDVITVGEASAAALQFGASRMLADARTELVVESEGVLVRNGRVQIRESDGNPFGVWGPFFRVNIGALQGAPGSAEIRVAGKRAQIAATSGVADVTALGNASAYELHAGEMATLDATEETAAGQSSANPAAGQVSRLLPQVQIDRASQELTASLSDPVYWNDDLRSGATGRARIALTDGSVLNLGSNTSLRVLQHHAQGQQTSLDLAVGRMRGQIMKLTRPGAKFEIRTPAGIAGLVGTDFSLLVTGDSTELIVFDGAVRFTGSVGGQATTVSAGMKLVVSKAGALEGPSAATPRDIEAAKNLTDVPDSPAQIAGHKNGVLIPVVVSLSAGGAVLGIGTWLAGRDSISPIKP